MPGLRIHVLKLLLTGDAGVVDQQRDMTERIFNLAYHPVDLLPVGDIRLKAHGDPAFFT